MVFKVKAVERKVPFGKGRETSDSKVVQEYSEFCI